MKRFLITPLFVPLCAILAHDPFAAVAGKLAEVKKEQSQHPFEKRAARFGQNFEKGPCFKGLDKKMDPVAASLVHAVCAGDLEKVKYEFAKAFSSVGNYSAGDLTIQNCKLSCTFHDKQGRTLLHWAAFYGFLPVVEFLVKNDAEINRGDEGGWTPLHYAAVQGYADVVRYLVQKGADVKACTKEEKRVWGLPISREVQQALENGKP